MMSAMTTLTPARIVTAIAFVAVGLVLGRFTASTHAQSAGKVFELRTYTAPDGKLGDLDKRFRDHTMRIFKNHGMTSVAYFRPHDAPLSQNTLIYLISHQSRDAAKANWAAFQADPEWQKVANESQKNGKIVAKVESVFLDPTDYSPMK